MKPIYIGGAPTTKKKSGFKWKTYFFLLAFFGITFSLLKVAAPTIVEKWINQKGATSSGYTFSIRDTHLSLSEGQVVLSDVKVFNAKTNTKILETSELVVQLNFLDLLRSKEKQVSIYAEVVDLILSKDFTSEMKRVHETQKLKNDLYFSVFDGKIGKLNIIEQKEDKSRKIVELNDVNVKVKEFTPLSINKNSEFSVTSKIADGGKLNLQGKATEENGSTPWIIQGSLKQVPAELLNKIAGDKLPFSFNESNLNAQITAHSDQGEVSGEITPDVKKLNLIDEKPGLPTQTIARALTDELTFTLPFTLNEEVNIEFAKTFAKLRNYRKDGVDSGT